MSTPWWFWAEVRAFKGPFITQRGKVLAVVLYGGEVFSVWGFKDEQYRELHPLKCHHLWLSMDIRSYSS